MSAVRRIIPASTSGDYIIPVNSGATLSFIIDNPSANSIIVKAQLLRADEITADDYKSGSAISSSIAAQTATTIQDSTMGPLSALIINFAAPSAGTVTVDILGAN